MKAAASGLSGHEIAEVSSTGSWNRAEIYAGARHLATYANGTTYFNHTDGLGTERMRINVSGGIYETCTSLPFGDWLTCSNSDPNPMHFTGDERDAETSLDHTQFRQYSSSVGRWSTSDPLGIDAADPSDPQTLNTCSYVRNNPLKYTDTSGLIISLRDIMAWNDIFGNVLGGGFYGGFIPIYGVFPNPGSEVSPFNLELLGYGTYGHGSGGGAIRSTINGALHQPNLSKCLHQFFGPGKILTNANLPYLDATLSVAQITSLTNTPAGLEATGTIAEPVPATGRGTVIVASENLGNLIQGERTYLHETANILAIQQFTSSGVTGVARAFLGPRGGPPTSGQVFAQTHPGNDPDIGRQFELCVFGADTTIVVH
jgi:RHS repeat-associated protein